MTPIGPRIRDERLRRGMTISDLAERAEISVSYLSQLERGERGIPAADKLFRLANALGTTMADLVQGGQPSMVMEGTPVEIPASLREFEKVRGGQLGLTAEDIRMLASIRYRGRQPQTPEDWEFLYLSIKKAT